MLTFHALREAGYDLAAILTEAGLDADEIARRAGLDPDRILAGRGIHKLILRYGDLEAMGFGCRSTIFRKWKTGKLPRPEDFEGAPGWRRDVIEEYLASRPDWTP